MNDEPCAHRQLAGQLVERLSAPALRCPEGEVRDLDRQEVVRVSDHDVQAAARCQAKAAAPPTEFEANIFTTSRAVALRSMRWLRREGSVIDAVGHTMRRARQPADDPSIDVDWLDDYLSDPERAPIDVRVRIAARATTWLTTTLAVLGIDDPKTTQGWRYDIRPRWRYPGRGLALDGRVDLSLPAVGNRLPVFVLTSLHPAVLDQAAYNICLWTIRQRKPPEEVLVVELPTSALHRLATDELLERGLDAAARAAEAVSRRPIGIEVPPVALTRTPSGFTCRDCPWAGGCEAKAAFDRQPAIRGGIQLQPSRAGKTDGGPCDN